jgi:trehalose synthase
VVVQKSIAEGFGLAVADAMWKALPVVASRIGGIQDQIVEGVQRRRARRAGGASPLP